MLKLAKLEDSELTDSKTGKGIRISTTTRILYRKMYPELIGMRNARLNVLIAKEFIASSSQILHYFRLGDSSKSRASQVGSDVAEIRGTQSFFYISAIRDGYIDILTVQSSWLKPKYKGSQQDPLEFGDS